MNSTLKNQIKKTLASVLSDFNDENEAFKFLEEFLTEKEFEILAKRLAIAYFLSKKRSYENIKTNLKVSSRTIAQMVSLPKKGPVKTSLKKLDADEWANKWSKKIRSFDFRSS